MSKLTNETLSKWLESQNTPFFNLPIEDSEIEVKTSLTEDEIHGFVDHVVRNSFDSLGDYSAAKKDFAFKATALQMLTNCPMQIKEGTTFVDVDKCAAIVEALNLLDEAAMIEHSKKFANLIVDLDEIVMAQLEYEIDKRLKEPLGMTDIAMMRITTLCDEVSAFFNRLVQDGEQGMEIMKLMVDSGLTPEKIADAALKTVKKSQAKERKKREKQQDKPPVAKGDAGEV